MRTFCESIKIKPGKQCRLDKTKKNSSPHQCCHGATPSNQKFLVVSPFRLPNRDRETSHDPPPPTPPGKRITYHKGKDSPGLRLKRQGPCTGSAVVLSLTHDIPNVPIVSEGNTEDAVVPASPVPSEFDVPV